MNHHQVIRQNWLESECGWGQRPDGYSLHLDMECRDQYLKEYWAGMPQVVPDEYSAPMDRPFSCEVDDETYQAIVKGNGSLRRF